LGLRGFPKKSIIGPDIIVAREDYREHEYRHGIAGSGNDIRLECCSGWKRSSSGIFIIGTIDNPIVA
jgi:hypothetical protein